MSMKKLRSLGIVAMNVKQMDQIYENLISHSNNEAKNIKSIGIIMTKALKIICKEFG